MDRLCGVTLCVFLSIEEVSIPKLEKIFRVPKIFEVSNFSLGFSNWKLFSNLRRQARWKPGPNLKELNFYFFFSPGVRWMAQSTNGQIRPKEIESKFWGCAPVGSIGSTGERELCGMKRKSAKNWKCPVRRVLVDSFLRGQSFSLS